MGRRVYARSPPHKRRRLNGFRTARQAGWSLVRQSIPRVISAAARYASARTARATRQVSDRRSMQTRRGGLPYHTRGRTAPRFKRVFRKQSTVKKYLQRGIVKVVERGGVVNDANCVYVGHGIGLDELFRTYCIAMCKKLLVLCGRFCVSLDTAIWDDSALDVSPGKIRFGYSLQETGVTYHEFTLGTGLNLRTLGELLYTNILGRARLFVSGTDNNFEIKNVSMTINDTAGVSAVIWKTLELTNLLVDLNLQTLLSLQNRTISSIAVGNDESNRNDVANNPVGGYKYTGRGNGFATKFKLDSPVTLVAEKTTGLITMDPDLHVGGIKNNYDRPPPASSFELVKRFGGVSLQPGSIKTDSLKHNVIMYNRTFWKVLQPFILGEAQITPVALAPYTKIGKCAMFAFEKHCNTRVDEPDISIGWELRQTIGVCFKSTKQVTQMYFDN